MDVLTEAAQSVFEFDEDFSCIPLTPKKGAPLTPAKTKKRTPFAEVTNTINISPDKFANSPLQSLFNAPTLGTPKTKSRNYFIGGNGSQNVILSSSGKSVSGGEGSTPNRNGVSPTVTTGVGLGRSPLTPMTNLKLLTRVASMEESLSRSSKKVLFEKEASCNTNDENSCVLTGAFSNASGSGANLRRYNSESLGQNQCKIKRPIGILRKHPTSDSYPAPSSPGNLVLEGIGRIPSIDDATSRPVEGSRKDKSLGLLSEKFLEQFPLEVSFLETPRRLVIDEVASMLKTERRRVYDIINVLESLNMATRVQKNMYQWTGKLHLEETLGRLKALGEKHNIAAQLEALKNERDGNFKVPRLMRLTKIGDGEKVDSRKEKSLSILCQKFLMILLVSQEPHMISLDNAIRLLVGDAGEGGDSLRARGRRLYDIANVLTSVGLVRRVPTAKAFQYIGPAVSAVINDEDMFGIVQRHSLLPSRNVGIEFRENVNLYGDHEVTPSEVTQPVQKRGRPRKLATSFSSTLPAPKRSRLQRARSEDVISRPRKMMRTPSLHDICQVAEVERERLIKEKHSYRSQSSESYRSGSSDGIASKFTQNVVLPNSDFRPISRAASPPASSLRPRLVNRAKIPVALTFQNTEKYQSNVDKENINSNIVYQDHKDSIYQGQNTHTVRNSQSQKSPMVGIKLTQEMRKSSACAPVPMSSSCQLPTSIHSVNIVQSNCSQNRMNQIYHDKQPVGIGKISTLGNKSYIQSRVVSVNSSVSQGAPVIKVITKTAASKQQDASTIMTVLPGNPLLKNVTMKPEQIIKSPRGHFQQLSEGTYTNGQKILISSSCTGENDKYVTGNSVETKQPNSFVVFTLSDNLPGQRTLLTRVGGENSSNSYQKPCVIQHMSLKPNYHKRNISALISAPHEIQTALGQQSLAGISDNHKKTTLASADHQDDNSSWHPSPDGSSTDSELEQIFGNSFNFSRPKTLLNAKFSKSSSSDSKS